MEMQESEEDFRAMSLAEEPDIASVANAAIGDGSLIDRSAGPSTDGDGVMLGRVLVYACIVIVGCAMLYWMLSS